MIRLEQPQYLLFSSALLLMAAAYLWYNWWRNKTLNKLGEPKLIEKLIPGLSKNKPLIKFTIITFAFAITVIGASNPQWGSSNTSVKKQGIDVAIVLDVSNSMMAQDVRPDRLTVGKTFATDLANHLPDNRIALVTFAGEPLLLMPLTPDHASLQMMLDNANVESAPTQGTDLGAAIIDAIHALPENQNHYKTIILISDGEDNENNIAAAIREANNQNISIFTASVGTVKGSVIPDVSPKRKSLLKKDDNGNTVVSKMNPRVLKSIAAKTNGLYVDLSESKSNPVNTILDRLDGMKKNKYDKRLLIQYESKFQYFLIIALILLLADLFVSNKKQQWFLQKPKQLVVNKKYLSVVLILLFPAQSLFAQTPAELVLKGNQSYERQNYVEAMQYYQQAIDNDVQHSFPQAIFNLGNVLYAQKKYTEAVDDYNQFLSLNIAPLLKDQAYFNLGNCYLAQNKYEESIAAFKNALSLNSQDADAQYNLSYAMAMLNKQKQQQQDKQKKPSASKITKQKKQPIKKDDTMPQDQINQMLNSLSQSEQKTQAKIQKENALTHRKTLDKDW